MPLKKRAGKRITLLLTVILAFAAASYYYFTAKMYVKVSCITPVVTDKSICVTGLGYLKEGKRTGYYFDIPVKVEQVYVKVGDIVTAGDPLLKIDLKATKLTAKMAAAGIITQESKSVETANILEFSKNVSIDINETLAKVPEFVYAAYDCVISGISVQTDEYSNPYSPLVTMSDRSVLCAEITVDERDAAAIKIGQKAVVSGSALDQKYTATVTSVAARATMTGTEAVTSGKVDIKLELSGATDSLVINSLVRADIMTATKQNMVIVPYEAVVFSQAEDYVFVNQDGLAVKKVVKTGRAFEDGIELISGISANDRVVISEKTNLQNGCKVKE